MRNAEESNGKSKSKSSQGGDENGHELKMVADNNTDTSECISVVSVDRTTNQAASV